MQCKFLYFPHAYCALLLFMSFSREFLVRAWKSIEFSHCGLCTDKLLLCCQNVAKVSNIFLTKISFSFQKCWRTFKALSVFHNESFWILLFSYYLGKPRARAVPWRIWKRFEASFLHGRNWIWKCGRIPVQLFRKYIHSDEEVRKLIRQIFTQRTFIYTCMELKLLTSVPS